MIITRNEPMICTPVVFYSPDFSVSFLIVWIMENFPYFRETKMPSIKNYTVMLYATRKENALPMHCHLNSDMRQ